VIEFVHRKAPSAPCRSKGLECDIKTNLVSVLEAVRQGLGDDVDPHPLPLDLMRSHPLVESGAREPNDLQGRITQGRLSGATVYRDPNLGWKLSADAMEPEGGEQADYAPRHRRADEGEPVLLGERARGNPIEATTDSFQLASGD
jgi:hypothetical protein